jgi:hypothetical protein
MAIVIISLIFTAGFATGFATRAQISLRRHKRAKKLRHIFDGAPTH